MKIVFVVGVFPSLSETFILNQITGLIDLGHEVEIFAQEGSFSGKIHPDVFTYNLKKRVHYFNIPKNRFERIIKAVRLIVANFYQHPLMILKSLNFVRYGKEALSLNLLYALIIFLDKNFDIIYCHFGPIGNIGAHLKQIGIKGKLVTVFYGADIRTGIIKGKNFYKNLFIVGDYFLEYTKYHIKTLIKLGVEPKKIIFHPLGVNIHKFSRALSGFIKKPSKFTIITVARLVEEKGLNYGIRAIKELVNNNPQINLRYNIVGGGPMEKSLKKLIKDINLTSNIYFLGYMTSNELIREMRKSQIFFLPSVSETFGIVLLEAQAMGLPVVATRIGGVPEAMIEGKSGLLVPVKNIKVMAKKIEYLLKNQSIRLKMGRFGRKFVMENYDNKKLNVSLAKIFQNLISKDE